MARTRGALPAPLLRHTTRQKASLAQVPSDSPSQAMDALLIPPSKGGETTRPSSLLLSAYTRREDQLLLQGRLLHAREFSTAPSGQGG
ncbi:hypothetical protein CK203_063410 [Vitis vinifera]|uniref:Uncharacterized protein n=1 Tax=Vitis vinifera TaxID=29760 RepID=A0A438G932_VITVI|nr:hypothetical protein CK203_063410 [Vitis vinifera]